MRRRDSKLVRLYQKRFEKNQFWELKTGSPERRAAVRLAGLCAKSWSACKKQAIERAAGI
ncbi:hypothetical protein RGR602_CH01672 [Rhizobium gallicum bv. gallicum R602sp]|uniref:Uncharacterized protein n=1 Tax=Rhizobium gallicum bv. gallicum R602sp TaxID=1041138 RepID=A0A0B4X1F8_9HYPH|nr:hypothetical protein RGR602_CH01672 [Rhizobium gallicum bv. gallicum R602sp]